MHKAQVVVSALFLAALLAACAPAAAPAPQAPAPAAAPARAPAPVVAPSANARPAWQAEWEKTLDAARKEGRVMMSSTAGADIRTAVVQGVKSAYGIDVEAVGANSGELVSRILAERRAGLYLRDIYLGGAVNAYTDMEPVSAIDPLDPALILPDVTDPELVKKTWYRGELWWVDPKHLVVAPLMFPHPPLAVNTTMVKPDEIKSYNDFLDPKWKGQMNINDPTQPRTTFASFAIYLYGPDWLRKLAKNEPVIMRDERLQLDWLAHGKQPIALGLKVELYTEFKKMGATIQQVIPSEGTWLSGGSTCVYMLNKPPHPNATKVVINWMLSKEGQIILSKASGTQSAREDVATDWLTSDQIRQPGVKYWEKERRDVALRKAEELKLAKEIFAPLMK